MLKLFPCRAANCEQTSRRRFMIDVGSLTGVGLSL